MTQYDPAGYITTQTLPDLRQIAFAYDPNGNVTGITPPDRPQHGFDYTPVKLLEKSLVGRHKRHQIRTRQNGP